MTTFREYCAEQGISLKSSGAMAAYRTRAKQKVRKTAESVSDIAVAETVRERRNRVRRENAAKAKALAKKAKKAKKPAKKTARKSKPKK